MTSFTFFVSQTNLNSNHNGPQTLSLVFESLKDHNHCSSDCVSYLPQPQNYFFLLHPVLFKFRTKETKEVHNSISRWSSKT